MIQLKGSQLWFTWPIGTKKTRSAILSFWGNVSHWLHRALPFWEPVTTISSNCISLLLLRDWQLIDEVWSGLKSYISISDWACYHNVSQSLEAMRFDVKLMPLLWNLTGVSAAMLLRHPCNFWDMRYLKASVAWLIEMPRYDCRIFNLILKLTACIDVLELIRVPSVDMEYYWWQGGVHSTMLYYE